MEPASAPSSAAAQRRGELPFCAFGLCLGLILFGCALTPSLVPRAPLLQGLIGGTVFAIGYGAAAALKALWRWLGLPEATRRTGQSIALLAAALGAAFAGYALSQAATWQNEVRVLMDLPVLESSHAATVLGVALATALVLMGLGWLIARLVRLIFHRLARVVSERLAIIVAMSLATVLVVNVVNGILVRHTLAVIDASYARLDRWIDPETSPPTDPRTTGSAQSLIEWSLLGRDGRRFIDGLTPQEDIETFWSGPAQQPIRVYVGLGAGEDAASRAALALAELKRVGAFGRDVLVLAVPTGTGFMDQAAIESLEYLLHGDVATVAQQYSYMQSPFSLIFEPSYGAEAARELFRTVYDYWTDLPPDDRPRLYLYGLSLGALSSERSLRLYEVLADPIQGALWVGPPFLSPIHRDITQARNPGSPQWKPVFEDGSLARFITGVGDVPPAAPWGPLRIVYIQHPSDPIVFFDFPMLWRQPDWMRPPRGDDVSPTMRWIPLVSALQVAADMALSNDVPLGHGHQYAPETYLAAWNMLIDTDVSAADLARLKDLLSER